jgi:pimeloyl-ACP methyl ester carboxylesterase
MAWRSAPHRLAGWALLVGFVLFCLVDVLGGELLKLPPNEAEGFSWPYYLYIPSPPGGNGHEVALLIIPNNSPRNNDYEVHDAAARALARHNWGLSRALGVVVLVPAFPRPANSYIYTYALDRDCLTTRETGLIRLDLQLIEMIEDAREQLSHRGLATSKKVLLFGFSASAMFANRFAVLHPELIAAAAIGSPGGWPIAPTETWRGETLRYPVGVADLEGLTGDEFAEDIFTSIPHFIFKGAIDENDSVTTGVGYEQQDRDLIIRLFGPSPTDRWDDAVAIYDSLGGDVRFREYAGVGHTLTDRMIGDIVSFLQSVLWKDDK